MARLIPNGMPYLGKVGNTLTKPTMKGYIQIQEYDPAKYNPTSTEEQIKVRARFRELTRIAHKCPDIMFFGLRQKAAQGNMTPRNWFVHLNWDNVRCTNVSTARQGETITNWPELVFNPYGPRPVNFGPNLDLSEPLTVTVSILDNGMWPADAKVAILAICPEADGAMVSDFVSASAHTLTLAVPTNWNGLNVHVYGFSLTNVTPLNATENIEDTNYQGPISATEWLSRYSTSGSDAMSNVVYLGTGEIG